MDWEDIAVPRVVAVREPSQCNGVHGRKLITAARSIDSLETQLQSRRRYTVHSAPLSMNMCERDMSNVAFRIGMYC